MVDPGATQDAAARGAGVTARASEASSAPSGEPAVESSELPWGIGRILPSATAVEAGALVSSGFGFLVGFIAGYLSTGGNAVPISGYGSVGGTSAVVAAVVAATAFVMGILSPRVPKRAAKRRRTGRFAWVVDVVALTLTHAAIVFMLVIGASFVVEQAFLGAPVYAVPAGLITGGIAAVAAYFSFLSAAAVDASRVATLLAVFLVSGALTSMLSATDPNWWHQNISALGVAQDFSGWAFNLTVVFGGLVLTTLARFVGGELDAWADGRGPEAARGSRLLTLGLALIGVCLAVVGLVPVSLSEPVHNTAATGMIVIFVVLVLALRWLLPGFSPAFRRLGYVFTGVIALAVLFFWPFGYYTLTATELIAVALIFAWLVVFIRNVAAAAHDRDHGLDEAPAAR